MNNINKNKVNDPIANVRDNKYFKRYSIEAEEKINLGIEIYNTREQLKMSQQGLAKKAETTQKVISRIENGDVNVGFSLLNRLARALNFNFSSWSSVFSFETPEPGVMIILNSNNTDTFSEERKRYKNTISNNISF